MKLPNGYGTVYKLSGNRRNPWIARKTTGWTEDRRQIYLTIGYFKEKTTAFDALSKYRIEPLTEKANITLKELYEEWSATKYDFISIQTKDNYKAGYSHIKKYEKIKFKELRTSHFQSIINQLYKDNKSRSTLEKIKILINMLYQYAMENDIINKNYAKYLKLPKVQKEEKSIFTDIEIKLIEKNADTVEWIDTIMILIYTGLRITELLELTKFNIKLDEKIITGGIKTDAGKNRIIPINDKIFKYIKKWYEKNGDYFICNENGSRMNTRKYREEYYLPALESIKVRKLYPHCCRHTCASLLSKAGADMIAIQKIMGHNDYSTTANIYTHPDIDFLRKNINLL